MVRSKILTQVRCAAILEGVGNVIERVLPLFWILLARLQPLVKNRRHPIAGMMETTSWAVRNPVGQQEVKGMTDICFHTVEKIKQLVEVVIVKVLSHQAPHDHPVRIARHLFEDLDVRFLGPVSCNLACFFPGDARIMFQGN